MKFVKGVLLALLFSLLLGFVIGTALRMRLEQPIQYIGSTFAPHPFDVSDSDTVILDPRHREERFG